VKSENGRFGHLFAQLFMNLGKADEIINKVIKDEKIEMIDTL
jgi:hypothetical protein